MIYSLIISLTIIQSLISPYNFFGSDYKKAIKIFTENKEYLFEQLENNEKYIVCNSIIFPEFIRYSVFKDFLEIEALKLGYVQFGSESIDFSIGYCQMKPSFIEKLEQKIQHSTDLYSKYHSLIQYNDTSINAIRKKRIERLEDFNYQVKYLSCFYDIMETKTKNFQWNSMEEKIAYYATAYNYNFSAPKESILKMQDAKIFPYGSKYKGEQFSYAEVSIYFFKKYLTD